LEALKNISAGPKSGKSGSGDASSSVLYELLMKPETSKMEEQRRVAEIERRLEAIEKAVGAAPDKMVRICYTLILCIVCIIMVRICYTLINLYRKGYGLPT
jgi:hypothetical protein